MTTEQLELIISLFLAFAIGLVFGIVGTVRFFVKETIQVPLAETKIEAPIKRKAKTRKIAKKKKR